jgi:two-component system, cell cycle response regulator CpdR
LATQRILLVDDDPDVRQLLEHVLLGEGYRVDTAETALKAASLVELNFYDLVLTDGVLPDGNGVAVADKASARGMKAVIITGYALRGKVDRHPCILKPVRPRELLEAVARHLDPDARQEASVLTILFVEDDTAVRDCVIRMLSERGFAVLTAADAFQALRVLAERPVDLLFADVVMPGMDGVALAAEAKRLRPGVKVLFITGFPLVAAERDAIGWGKLLYKPLRQTDLLREVEAALA